MELIEKVNLSYKKRENECQAIIATCQCNPIINNDEIIDHVKLYTKLDSNKNTTEQLLLLSESDGIQYFGQNFGDHAPVSNLYTKYMVGIFNKSKQKLRILETSYFIMNPHFNKSQDVNEDRLDESSKTNKSQIEDLIKAFGTSKSRRIFDSRNKNKISDGILADSISSAVQNTLLTDKPTLDESVGQYMPVCNEKATNVQDIYPIENVISKNEMDLMDHSTFEFLNCTPQIINEWLEIKKYPIYILNHLQNLPSEKEAKIFKIKYLLYLHYMLLLFNLQNFQLRNKGEISKLAIPLMIKKILLDQFTRKVIGSETQQTMPMHLRDSLIMNMLIICLTLDEFTSDVKTLNMTIANGKDLSKYLRQLGCKVGEKATLSVPFVKPMYIKRASKRLKTH